ncbi:MAG: hypothetical protein V7609_789 [Verrucomicrobiota bacterium]
MKKDNRGGAPVAGLAVAAILLVSMTGYVCALSGMFQSPLAYDSEEGDFLFDEALAPQPDARPVPANFQYSPAQAAPEWLMNVLPGYSSGSARLAWYSLLESSGDRLGFETGGNFNAPTSGGYVLFNPNQLNGFAPATGFVSSKTSPAAVPSALSGSVDFAWNVNGGSSWSTTTNWTPTAPTGGPSAPGIYVTINTNPTANATITLFNTGNGGTAVKTVGRLDIGDSDGSNTFTISAGTAAGILNFDGDGANAQLNQLSTSNNNTISAPVTLTTSLDITNASANTLTLSSGGITAATAGTKTLSTSTGLVTISGVIGNGSGVISLVKSGAGTLTLSGANTYSGGTSLTGGTITLGISSVVTSGVLASGAVGTGTFNIGSAAGVVTLQTNAASSTPRTIENNISLDGDIIFATTGASGRIALNTLYSGTGAGASLLTTPNTIVLTRTNQFTVNNTVTVDLIGAVSGGFGITKLGAGTLNIGSTSTTGSNQDANANTYTGLTTVSAGTAVLTKTAGTDAIAGNVLVNGTGILAWNHSNQIKDTSDVTVNDTGVLNLDNSSETFDALNGSSGASILLGSGTLTVGANNENIFTYAGTSSGTGGLTKTGSGILILSGSNGYTGSTTIAAGELLLTPSGSLATASTIRLGDTAINSPSAMFTFGDTAGGETIANPTIVQASASGTEGTRTILGLATSGNTNTWTGNITLNTDLTVQSAAVGSTVANGPGILLFQGGTIDVLDNAFMMNSNLRGNNADTYSIQGTVRINEVLGSSLATGGSVVKDGSGTLILQGTSNTYTGTNPAALNPNGTTIRGGILGIFGDGSLGLAPTTATNNVFFNSSAFNTNNDSIGPTLRADAAAITLGATRNINIASGATATFDSNANTFGIAGIINGGGNLAKIGQGTLVLSGNNTYTGTTTVDVGTLLVNGNQSAATGAVTVNNSGTTLGGNGIIGGPVTVNSGANLAPGSSTGIITTGSVTLNSGSNFVLELNNTTPGTGYDQLVVNGSVTLNLGNIVVIAGGGLQVGDKFFVVVNDGTDPVLGAFAQGGTVTSGSDTFLINYLDDFGGGLAGNDISLTLQAIPEPSTWIVGALALAAIGFTQRKRFARRSRVIG